MTDPTEPTLAEAFERIARLEHQVHLLQGGEPKIKASRTAPMSPQDLMQDGLTEQAAIEFLAHRKRMKCSLTPLAWSGIKREAQKARLSLQAAIEMTLTRGWRAFSADYVRSAIVVGGAKRSDEEFLRDIRPIRKQGEIL